MHATAKLFLVVLVLGVGVVSALVFRRPAPPESEFAPQATPQTLVLRGQPTHIGPPATPGTWKADFRQQATTGASHMPVPIAVPASPQLRRDPPPQMPSLYDRNLPSVTRPILEPVQVSPAAEIPVHEIPVQELPKLTIVDPRGPALQRTHKIQDGDTLRSLAEKYLGDSARHGEIFSVNSDLLSNPDLLPIGTVLKIPAAGSAAVPEVSVSEVSLSRETELAAPTQGLPVSQPLPSAGGLPRQSPDIGPLVPIPRGVLQRRSDKS